MYLLALYITLVVGSLVMTTDDYNGLVEDAKYALSFTTNLQNIYKHHDYFELVQTYKVSPIASWESHAYDVLTVWV